jgi:hypothetical protein
MVKATKSFSIQTEARKEEARLKRQKSQKYLEWLIAGNCRHALIAIGVGSNAGNGSTPFRGTHSHSVIKVALGPLFIFIYRPVEQIANLCIC